MKNTNLNMPTTNFGIRVYFLEETLGKLNFIAMSKLSQNEAYIFGSFELNGKIYIKGAQRILKENNIVDYFDTNTSLKYEFWLVEESKNKNIKELGLTF